MRLAGSPKIPGVLAAQEAAQSAASIDEQLDRFFRLNQLLLSKGYSENAAALLATEMLDGRVPETGVTRRFAGVYGDAPAEP